MEDCIRYHSLLLVIVWKYFEFIDEGQGRWLLEPTSRSQRELTHALLVEKGTNGKRELGGPYMELITVRTDSQLRIENHFWNYFWPTFRC